MKSMVPQLPQLNPPLQSARAMVASILTSPLGKLSYELPKHNPDHPQASSASTLTEWTRTEIAPKEPPQAFQRLREQAWIGCILRVKESDRRICRSHQERILAPWSLEGRQDGAVASRAVPVRVTRSREW